MWQWLAIVSACLLGFYDVTKKQALKRNGVLEVLLGATAFTALFLSPFLKFGPLTDHLMLVAKAAIVSISWISGLAALRLIPLTTASTLKAIRPVLVVMCSILIFDEKLNIWQWAGVVMALTALFMLSRSSRSEGIDFKNNRGILYMTVSILSGAGSALYDKVIIADLEPLFVQSWTNVYITIILALTILLKPLVRPEEREKFSWDWNIVLIAVLITVSDALYFFAIKQEGSLLSVISLIRRCSVIITFILGAILFKEKKIRSKAASLATLMVGVTLLVMGSSIS